MRRVIMLAMGRAAATRVAGIRAGAAERIRHDGADGSRAAAAIRAAAEALVDLSRGARTIRAGAETRLHVTIGEQVAGANDHAAVP